MHPPLAHHKHEVCKQFIEALEACHKDGYKKFFGQCNELERSMTMCLRAERIDRTQKNREEAKEKRKQIQEKWKSIDQES